MNKYLAFGAPDYTKAEIEAVSRVMRSGWVGMGQETLAFEKELAAFFGCEDVVTVNSCTSALFLSLVLAGLQPGDEVIVPSLTWCADAHVILQLGGIPVFCDVDEKHFCLTPETVKSKLTSKTKAVIAVHFGGRAVDVEVLRARLPDTVAIIEDAAHALGAVYPQGKKVGNSKNPVCFSFYANKNLSTAEGGAVALNDKVKADRLRKLRLNGMCSNAWSRYINPENFLDSGIEELGYKMNYTDLQAAIGRVQLARFETMAQKRRELVDCYLEKISQAGISVPFQAGLRDAEHARHLLAGVFDPAVTGMPRNELLLSLRKQNIGASLHYEPLHQMSFFKKLNRGELPVTEKLAARIMTLPLSAKMTLEDACHTAECLNALISGRRKVTA